MRNGASVPCCSALWGHRLRPCSGGKAPARAGSGRGSLWFTDSTGTKLGTKCWDQALGSGVCIALETPPSSLVSCRPVSARGPESQQMHQGDYTGSTFLVGRGAPPTARPTPLRPWPRPRPRPWLRPQAPPEPGGSVSSAYVDSCPRGARWPWCPLHLHQTGSPGVPSEPSVPSKPVSLTSRPLTFYFISPTRLLSDLRSLFVLLKL